MIFSYETGCYMIALMMFWAIGMYLILDFIGFHDD